MTDKLIATLSIIGLILFTSVVVIFVKEIDLAVVIVLCLLIAAHDFWMDLRAPKNGSGDSGNE